MGSLAQAIAQRKYFTLFVSSNHLGESPMKVFISSLITGMEAERAAVKHVVEVLRHQPIMAEEFGSRPSSPQVACLSELRDADLVILVLGSNYGVKQANGFSATHQEFKEAQNRKPILTFVQSGDPESDQTALIKEASGWEKGQFWAPYSSVEDLKDKVYKALYDHALANARAPLDPHALNTRALSLLPERRRDGSTALFQFALAAGPDQAVLRPAQIESPDLSSALEQHALFGPTAVFQRTQGTKVSLERDALVIEQEGRYNEGAKISLWPTGDVFIQLPADRPSSRSGFPVLIEEDVAKQVQAALAYADWLLGHIDPTQRLSHVSLAVRVLGGSMFGWRTEREHDASPDRGSFSMYGQEEARDAPVQMAPPHMARQALTMNAAAIVEDLVALLRRQWTRR